MTVVSRVAKYATLAFLASTYKTLPFAYFFRFYYHVLVQFVLQKRKFDRTNRQNSFGISSPSEIFRWVGIHSYVSPLELDMYLHKSNSTYFLDLDIARSKLVLQVFQKLFFNYYDNFNGHFKAKGIANFPYVPAASLECHFKRELKLFQSFEIRSRVYAWDDKWVYILSKFVTGKKGEKVHAMAVTKYVFKRNGRITIAPQDMLKECGLWNEEVEKENAANYKWVKDLKDPAALEEACAE